MVEICIAGIESFRKGRCGDDGGETASEEDKSRFHRGSAVREQTQTLRVSE
jgi:hypothetical protein